MKEFFSNNRTSCDIKDLNIIFAIAFPYSYSHSINYWSFNRALQNWMEYAFCCWSLKFLTCCTEQLCLLHERADCLFTSRSKNNIRSVFILDLFHRFKLVLWTKKSCYQKVSDRANLLFQKPDLFEIRSLSIIISVNRYNGFTHAQL